MNAYLANTSAIWQIPVPYGKYQCHMANTSAIWQQAAHSTCSKRAIHKILTLNENLVYLEKKVWRMDRKNDKTERARDSTEKQESR